MKIKQITLILLLVVACLSSGLAVTMFQKSVSNTMSLKSTYDFALYEHSTTTAIVSIVWGEFNESETKEYIFDLKYLGNVQGKIWYSTNMPADWSLVVMEKNHDASSWNTWGSGITGQITGLEQGHLKNVKLILTEVTAVPLTPYSFTISFFSEA